MRPYYPQPLCRNQAQRGPPVQADHGGTDSEPHFPRMFLFPAGHHLNDVQRRLVVGKGLQILFPCSLKAVSLFLRENSLFG